VGTEADRLLDPIRATPASAGVLTDFDGTLAPIVADPTMSRPLPIAVETLHRLAGIYHRVAVVSGRPASFLSTHLRLRDRSAVATPGEGLVVVGLYGLEMADGDQITTDPRAVEWRTVIDHVADLADEHVPPGMLVERKGLSLTLHYRTSPDQAGWAERWAGEQATNTGLLMHPARKSVELRPPLDVDKGTVVAGLTTGLEAVCFLGDDSGDLPAFGVLDRLRDEQGVATLKVGVRSEEAPPELLERADLVVDGPEGAVDVLIGLLDSR
jgi:trehalose 6-phosphate phosphatase